MNISQLSLQNFRSHAKKTVSFSSQTSVILGPNGSGKTNILEAIFLSATGKSFRADSDRELIEFGQELARVQVVTEKSVSQSLGKDNKEEKMKLEVILTTGSVHNIKTPYKKFLVNGVGRRMTDFTGNLRVVLFWPEDLELVTDSPSLRRRYLDFVLTQVDREYHRSLSSYERGVRQRNRLLESIRDEGKSRSQLLFWDQLLIKNGTYITQKREEYIEYLNRKQITDNNQQLQNYQLVYDNSIISPMRLAQYKEEEVAAATTLVGPHRDNFQFSIFNFQKEEKRDLSHFGSRGEQRLGILWLKLGELAFIEQTTGDKPVLLLDDIFSELDHAHRGIVFGLIGQQQTILTVADEHFVERGKLKHAEIITL